MRFDAGLAALAALSLGANGAAAQAGETMAIPLCNGGAILIHIPTRDGLPRKDRGCEKACHARVADRKGRRVGGCCA